MSTSHAPSPTLPTSELLQLAKAHMTGNYRPPPFVLDHGDGTRVWDADGTEYIDFTSGIGVNALGHAHPTVVRAVSEQVGRLSHTSNLFHHAGYIEMCARLCELSFGERAYLCNSGAEAVEAALKVARRYFYDRGEERTELVATHGGFHGRTMGAITLTAEPAYKTGFAPLVPGISHVPFGDVDAMRAAVGPHTAAVIVEPIQGNSGVVVAPDGFLAALRALCDDAGCLLIFDEVQTGIGRTGRWFAHEHDGVTPDLMCLAKALGGGLPLGALVLTAATAEVLKPGVHASTFGGNPVACAAGLATLDVIAEQGLVQRAAERGAHFAEQLEAVAAETPAIQEVRGRGLMQGVVVDADAKAVLAACRERGLLVTTAGAHVIRLLPPLIVTEEELEVAAEIVRAAVEATA